MLTVSTSSTATQPNYMHCVTALAEPQPHANRLYCRIAHWHRNRPKCQFHPMTTSSCSSLITEFYQLIIDLHYTACQYMLLESYCLPVHVVNILCTVIILYSVFNTKHVNLLKYSRRIELVSSDGWTNRNTHVDASRHYVLSGYNATCFGSIRSHNQQRIH